MKTYTALTIGPIYKSLQLAKKTRELWTASYLFSYLMKTIIEKLRDNDSIVLPYPDKETLIISSDIDKDKIKSAGIFPDRLIVEGKKYEALEKAIKEAIAQLTNTFDFPCDVEKLTQYLLTYLIEFDYTPRDLGNDEEGKRKEDNIIYQAYDYLAITELQQKYTPVDDECILKMFDKLPESKFYKSLFDNNLYGTKGFPSIFEIATRGLDTTGIDLNDDRDDNEIWKEIKEKNDEIKTHHKYIAIVQADGDNISKIIARVAKENDKNSIKEFSKKLTVFSLKAAEKVAEYQGIPVYAGGDDLLFFAPVSNGEKNIFELIEDLDKLFNDEIKKEYGNISPEPSLSYGLSISYYKYPMHEALATARELLFKKAKDYPGKNALAVKVLKHSGQVYETIIQKPFEQKFLKLVKSDKGLVLSSVLHKLEDQKILLKKALEAGNKAHIDYFFENFYDEDIHKKEKPFLENVRDLIKETYNKNENDFDKTFEQIKAQLQIIKFLNSVKDEQ